MSDPIELPAHYCGGIQPWDACAQLFGWRACVAHAFKYLWRAGSKGPAITDLRKARQWIDRAIRAVEEHPE